MNQGPRQLANEAQNLNESGRKANRRREEIPRAEEDLSQAGIPVRARLRDHGPGVRENASWRALRRAQENILMSKWNTRTNAADLKLRLAAEILRARSPIEVRASGISMLPSIRPGDVLAVENCDPSEVRAGDIIRFMRNGRFVIHRVLSVARDSGNICWTTRGDSLTREDSPVSEKYFVGRVCSIRRKDRWVPTPAHPSRTAQWVGRTLHALGSLQEYRSRVRLFLFKRRDAVSGLAKV